MHDVLDARDLVPDEAEQLLHSGFPAGRLLEESRAAAAATDYERLDAIAGQLRELPREAAWPYEEPDDIATLFRLTSAVKELGEPTAELPGRIHGAWLGRCAGNTMGKPVEGLTRTEVRLYLHAVDQWPQTGYLPLLDPLPAGVSHLHESAPFATRGHFTDVPRDDDLDWTVLGLWMLENYGADLTTEDVARSWLDRLPFTQTFTAERAAYRNLIRGVPAARAAGVDNPYREWIGALIRADIFGMTRPGRPGAAAQAALVDARLSHVRNGIYGEMWAAALMSVALTTADARVGLEVAAQVIPARSRLSATVNKVLALHRAGATSDDALGWVDSDLGHYNWVHTVNNAALISIGLLWGESFTDAVALAISGGRDTDSTAATVGGVYGALHGVQAIPATLIDPRRARLRSAVQGFDRTLIAELADRTVSLVGVLS